MTVVITDSTVLIISAKTDLLDIIINHYKQIIIPSAIYEECVIQGKKSGKLDALYIEQRITSGQIKVQNLSNHEYRDKIMKDFRIHTGEAECIALFFEINAEILGSDDLRTLKVCKIFQIPTFTILSFLIFCSSNKILSKNQSIIKLEQISEIGWYKKEIIQKIEMKINEGK